MLLEIYKFIKRLGPLFLLLCFALTINHRTGYITLIGIFSVLVFIAYTLNNKLDKTAGIILLYVFTYVFFSIFNGFTYPLSTLILYLISPFIFYQYGHIIVSKCNSNNMCMFIWFVIIFTYCVDIFCITIQNIIVSGQIINPTRFFSFNEEDPTKVSATGIGLPMDIGMIGLPMFFIVKSKYLRICFISLFFLSLLTTLHLLNRTGLIIAAFCSISIIFLHYRKNIKKIFIFFFVIIFIVYIMFYLNIINDELLEFYNSRNEDFSTMGSRSYRWSDAFNHLFFYWFGWYDGNDSYFIHNMWLDIARISGIIPFSLLCYLTYDSFRKVLFLMKHLNSTLSFMLLGLNICFFSSCFVEPIYGGTHMMLYCMLWGTQNALVKLYKKQKNENTFCNWIISD